MKPTAILFDLDGTLLPMEQEAFIEAYMKRLAANIVPHGYEPKTFLQAIYAGITAMVKNDGSVSNEEAFWNCFCGIFGERALLDQPIFNAFYENEFQQVKESCGFDARAAALIKSLKAKGYRLILATNPLFPQLATHSRIRWAGLEAKDFELVTTYENSSFCKPNPKYYEEILEKTGLRGEECLMVGNDVGEDMIAKQLGMRVFLLTDCLINRKEEDISAYPNGSFDALDAYIESL